MPMVNIRRHGHAHGRRAHARARGCARRCLRRGAGGHRGHPPCGDACARPVRGGADGYVAPEYSSYLRQWDSHPTNYANPLIDDLY